MDDRALIKDSTFPMSWLVAMCAKQPVSAHHWGLRRTHWLQRYTLCLPRLRVHLRHEARSTVDSVAVQRRETIRVPGILMPTPQGLVRLFGMQLRLFTDKSVGHVKQSILLVCYFCCHRFRWPCPLFPFIMHIFPSLIPNLWRSDCRYGDRQSHNGTIYHH